MTPPLLNSKIKNNFLASSKTGGTHVASCGFMRSMNRLIRMAELPDIVGYKPWSIYRLIRAGEFPQAVKLGKRAVAWRESDISEWIDSREVTG